MTEQRNTFFWSLVSVLVLKKQYEMIHLVEDQSEVWLRYNETIVRCKREDIEFDTVLRNDIFDLYEQLHALKKGNRIRNLRCINTYITSNTPIDEYKEVIEQALTKEEKKIGDIEHVLLDADDVTTSVQQVEDTYKMSGEDIQYFQHLLSLGEEEVAKQLFTYLHERQQKRNSLLNYGKPIFTYFFIALQGLMFLLLELNGGSENTETLIKYGAKYNPLIMEGEWWRLVTPIVLHIGFLHLAMNTLALYYIGTQVEKIFGSIRFLFIYLFAGITGVLLSFAMNDSVAAGASGAIFGCFGAFLYIGIKYRDVLSKSIMKNVAVIIVLNIVVGSASSTIDNAGHIGGLIGGFLLAMILQIPNETKNTVKRIALSVLTGVLIVGVSIYGFDKGNEEAEALQLIEKVKVAYEKNDVKEAEKLLQELGKYENRPLEAHYLEGIMSWHKKDYKKAREKFLYLADKKEDFHPAYFCLALISAEENKMEEANKFIEKALKYDKGNKEYEKVQKDIKRSLSS